ncbi:MAG: hypothetical protein R6V58_17045 [Planctomycetota bacterium]
MNAKLSEFLRAGAAAAVLGLAAWTAPARGGETVYFKPGRWVRLPEGTGRHLIAPGTATVVEDDRAEAQYALPMTDLWAPETDAFEVEPVPAGALLVAELNRSPKSGLPAEGVRSALPAGSAVIALDGVRERVPDSVDLVVSYYFSEGKLTARERAALVRFVRRGGAAVFVFGAGSMPAASEPVWRRLLGIEGGGVREVGGLPRGFLVPDGFSPRRDVLEEAGDKPTFLWRRSGRGVVVAYNASQDEPVRRKADAAAALFARIVARVQEARRPVRLGPIAPGVYRLFGGAAWSGSSRRRLAWLAAGYAVGAAGLLVSLGGLLRGRGWSWLVGLGAIAAAGAATIGVLVGGDSGLALETYSVVLSGGETEPVELVIGRVARLGRGRPCAFRSAGAMPPKAVLYDRYSAVQKEWAAYRFRSAWSSIEPLLDVDQSLCLVSVRWLDDARASALLGAPDVRPPSSSGRLVDLVERELVVGKCRHRWVEPDAAPRLFTPDAARCFTQVRRHPTLVVRTD